MISEFAVVGFGVILLGFSLVLIVDSFRRASGERRKRNALHV
jgi:hypothetical protein